MSGRPLDVLEETLGAEVVVHLKSGETYAGELAGYDQHMNLVLEPTDAEATADAGPVADTTIIRGDNVVTIQP